MRMFTAYLPFLLFLLYTLPMTHPDHVRLIQNAIPKNEGGIWADIGSGTGAFTLALRDIAGPKVKIYSIDKDQHSLNEQKEKMDAMFPETSIQYLATNFTQPLDLPPLDGILAANSIHFQKDTAAVLRDLAGNLKPGGTLLIVEYNTDTGNPWVPFPFSYHTFQLLAKKAGLQDPQLLSSIPSNFLNEIYSAQATKP